MFLDKQEFFKSVLLRLGILPNVNNLNFLMQWSKFELRKVGVAHGFNPLNTTFNLKSDLGQKNMKGSINAGFPVKDYSTFNNGVTATANTLKLPYYKNIFKALENGVSLNFAYQNSEIGNELKKWGSHTFAAKFNKKTSPSVNPLIVGLLLITATYLYFTFNKNHYYSNS